MERAMARFRGARDKGDMTFLKGLGVSQQDRMERALRQESVIA